MNYPQKNIVHGNITAGGIVIIGDTTYANSYFSAQEVKIPYRLTNNIPTNADYILGRAAELAQTKDYLARHQATILFNGIGGIGKTALASKYMAIYGSEYKHLAWITVQSSLAEAFINNAALLASLHITPQVQNYIAAKQLDKAFEYLFHQLNLLERTLVVIDNANDLEDLDLYKNWFDTANCHFLITSRSQPSEWAMVEVDSLPENEAVELFRKLYSSVSVNDEAIKSLLSKLFYHTLLIELVAKAGACSGIPFADLQNMIETKFIHDKQLNEDIVNTGKHGDNYKTKRAKIEEYIWLIFNNIKDLGENARRILKCMALLPLEMSQDRDEINAFLSIFGIEPVFPTLTNLVEAGWITKIASIGEKPLYNIHPLIVDVILNYLDVNVRFAGGWIQGIAGWIHYRDTNPEHDLHSKYQYKNLAERLSDLFFDENTEEMAYLLDRLGYLEVSFGFYQKSLKYRKRALAIAERIFDEQHPTIAEYQSNLAVVYLDLGKYPNAVSLLEMALKSNLNHFDKNHLRITNCQTNLAYAYEFLGRSKEAVELLKTALESDLKKLGENHPSVALRRNALAMAYRSLGQRQDSIKLLEIAISSDLKNFGAYHPEVARKKNNLAVLFQDIGNYLNAIGLLEEALKINLSIFNFNHPAIITNQHNLAIAYSKVGRAIEAKKLWQTAYQSACKSMGVEHPHTILLKKSAEM